MIVSTQLCRNNLPDRLWNRCFVCEYNLRWVMNVDEYIISWCTTEGHLQATYSPSTWTTRSSHAVFLSCKMQELSCGAFFDHLVFHTIPSWHPWVTSSWHPVPVAWQTWLIMDTMPWWKRPSRRWDFSSSNRAVCSYEQSKGAILEDETTFDRFTACVTAKSHMTIYHLTRCIRRMHRIVIAILSSQKKLPPAPPHPRGHTFVGSNFSVDKWATSSNF